MGPFGSSIKVETFVPQGIPVISGQHLRGARLTDLEYNFISLEHAEELANANVRRGDVVFTHAGNIGQVAYIPESSKYERYVISQRQFYLRPNTKRALPEFIAYYFMSADGQHKLLANASSSGVPSIAQPVSYLRTIEIPLPPVSEQRAIAQILGTLDDKIELNHRMNKTLESAALTTFQSWFSELNPERTNVAELTRDRVLEIGDGYRAKNSELGELRGR
jgi:type I restriction enzyme S subunit